MTVTTVPLDDKSKKMLDALLSWEYTNKADVFRNALEMYYEDKLLQRLLKAKKEVEDGIFFEGNLKDIAKKFKE